ncbi:MAG: DNA-processing protein DprA [Cyanobacteria bacterium J06632_22]
MTLTAAEPPFIPGFEDEPPTNADDKTTAPGAAMVERAYWVAWSQVDGVGPVLQKRLFLAFGSLAGAWDAAPNQLLAVDGIGLLLADQIAQSRSQLSPTQLLSQFEARSQSFWTPADADYPAALFEISDPPPVLYYRGPLRLRRGLTVGIVGTRHPSDYGRRWTTRLTDQLLQQGALVVSGMARGVDAIAHRSCIAAGAPTVAVLGTGVDLAYPSSNRTLHQQIIETGLVLSEYPDGTPPDRAHFPRRNRIIAGLSQAVLVTEAPERSGALITAHLANDYGREVYALPGSLDNPRSQGCLNLIEQGCQPIVSEAKLLAALGALPIFSGADLSGADLSGADLSGADLSGADLSGPGLAAASVSGPSQPVAEEADSAPSSLVPSRPSLSPELADVFAALSAEPMGLDALAQKTGQATSQLLSNLMQLELQGYVTQLPGMQYQRT